MAQNLGLPYLDYFSAMTNVENGLPEAYTTDGLHLTRAGYWVMEGLVETMLSKVLKESI